MAYGNACCQKGLKAYFIKATELNEKFTKARRTGTESSAISGLVSPSCLIIDEIGRSIFDTENTRLFFDMIDRRCSKEGPNCMSFTSNLTPDKWRDFFRDEDSLLCALDRTFDAATVYLMKGESYRGRNLNKNLCIAPFSYFCQWIKLFLNNGISLKKSSKSFFFQHNFLFFVCVYIKHVL